ncbi:transposase [Sphingobacterium sp. SRCM116780]|uniref:transposase n=1 Tax=Sphingobacterium sp. SRCM116780 TaxID=2907623 RepID=UPI001F475758|nr:transposase [Sphingobacterium sp. SRCM116780]UIR54517.1 transposase [Sphingobacterium sp. SRCM116780]
MKKLAFLIASAFAITSCANSSKTNNQDDLVKIQKETIKIHDEIMPQISAFDKSVVTIDSILTNLGAIKTAKPALDTTNSRQELTQLQKKLDDATDHMMDWMKDYRSDSTTLTYANSELAKVKTMKALFETVSKEKQEILNKY